MESALLNVRIVPFSPTQRFSPRVDPLRVTSLSVSRTQSLTPTPSLHRFTQIQKFLRSKEPLSLPIGSPKSSSNDAFESETKIEDDKYSSNINLKPSGRGLVQNAASIGLATFTSKLLGLVREITVASVFGIGPVATAFKYAYVLPGFSAALLGGVNGPIHITMATTLSKLSKERRSRLFQHTNFVFFLVGGLIGALVLVTAEFIIHIYAPGLWILAEGRITREIAIAQLKIMIPCIVLAGPVGLGFGYMSAEGNNILPSISPALSSIFIIASCFTFVFTRQLNAFQSGDQLFGGILISCGASIGILLQWVIQVIVLWKKEYCLIPLSRVNILMDKDVQEFFSLLLPAAISSALAQVASFTDLCFSSIIPGATAGLSYAYLLVMAPVGILSSVIILPLLPTFSEVTKTSSRASMVENLKRAFLLCMVVMLPILSIMCVLAKPIIRILFERYAFDSAASTLVSSLFVLYALGSPFYIFKELLVVVFYALGDGRQPFLVSFGAISLNAILDWLFVSRFYFGAQGLAISTSFTTALSALVLFHLLQKKLPGIADYAALLRPLVLLLFCCILSGFSTDFTFKMMHNLLSSIFTIRFHKVQKLLAISSAGAVGMIVFFIPLMLLHLSGSQMVRDLSRVLQNR
ncbi:Lipid II flippase [Actinidia chinensis var. chinensis]|uniref:Lipid II flippase n=1 Tax=Actinidia chinensis var. chinensis TaxID=1590841 RepID=A0A2R6RK26_ACTCC|nr:Lipid II flippase [Actinidia chinensis var. chinensis]